MADGPGVYDAQCTLVREQTAAAGVLLMVVRGDHGSGFSVQTNDPALLEKLPAMLRSIAQQIEDGT